MTQRTASTTRSSAVPPSAAEAVEGLLEGDVAAAGTASEGSERPLLDRARGWASPRNIGAIYLWLVIVAVFAIWVPNLFLGADTAKSILNVQAVAGLVALALVLPLAAGVFDLSVAYTVGLANVLMSSLIMQSGMSVGAAITVTLLVGLLVGVINATIVVAFRVDSFIATLGTSALLGAGITMVSDNLVTTVSGSISDIARWNVGGVTGPVFYMLLVAAVLWFMLQHTVTGRYLYAIGFNRDAARLAGIRVDRLRATTLVVSSLIATFAGIVLTARLESGTPTIGPPYLLPAFAAAFLGATQFQRGRFNAWGTVIAILLLGTGTVGLSLAEAPVWASDVFVGAALLGAVGITGIQRAARA